MKPIRIALVALIAVFALSAVAASSALAAPEWYAKTKGVYAKITTPLNVTSENTLELSVLKYSGNKALIVSCTSTAKGTIGAGAAGNLISEFTTESCVCKAVCLKFEHDSWFGRPFKAELYKEGTEIRDKVLATETGLPGWEFGFELGMGRLASDNCTFGGTSAHMSNVSSYVEAEFDKKSAKTKCEVGGAESGEWKGKMKIKPESKEVEAIKAE